MRPASRLRDVAGRCTGSDEFLLTPGLPVRARAFLKRGVITLRDERLHVRRASFDRRAASSISMQTQRERLSCNKTSSIISDFDTLRRCSGLLGITRDIYTEDVCAEKVERELECGKTSHFAEEFQRA